MTTYTVAYPHPSIPHSDYVDRFDAESDFSGGELVGQLVALYPELRDDLEDAVLWKAGHSSVAQLPP